MGGDRIKNAKSMLTLLINSFPDDSFFNIIKFGSDFEPLFRDGSKRYGRESVESALKLAESLDSDCGGTELVPAMKWVVCRKTRNVHI
jgi:hypothetical protein